MTEVTIHLPDHLAAFLRDIAADQNKTLEQMAVDRLVALAQPGNPKAIGEAMKRRPPIAPLSAEELDTLIAEKWPKVEK